MTVRKLGRAGFGMVIVCFGLTTLRGQPTNLGLTASGSGGNPTFTFSATSSIGIENYQMAINWTLDGAGGCVLNYNLPGNTLQLLNDAGSQFLPGYAPGTNNTIQNSQCTLNVASSSISGSPNNLSVTISVTFNSSFIGPNQVWGWVSDQVGNASGWQLLGSWTAFAAPYTQSPSGLSVTPNIGTGMSQLLTFHASDLNGYGYIPQMLMQITPAGVNTANVCYINYDRAARSVSLMNDAGNSWGSGGALGSSPFLTNNQCSISLAQSSATGSGNDLYLNLAVTFTSGFSGPKNVYEFVYDHALQSVGWTQVGTWTVGASQLVPDSVTPSSGSGGSQLFTFTASSPNGYAYIENYQMVINWALDGAGGCVVNYNQPGNTLQLLNDAGTQYGPGYAPGSNNTIYNDQCTINLASSTLSGFSNTLVATLSITFNNSFVGANQVYSWVSDQGGSASGWQLLGSWTAFAAQYTQLPSGLSVTPNIGTGMSQFFTFHANDLNGYLYIPYSTVVISPTTTLGYTNACYFYVDMASQYLSLFNDAATAIVQGGTLNASGTVSNDQCSINLAQSSISGTGNDLNLYVFITFAGGFTGPKGVFQSVEDRTGASTGMQSMGTWTVGGGQVATPTFNPSGGTYTSAQTVTISTMTSGASIRYTTNGTTPSTTNGTLYSGSFTVSSTTILKAIAYESGMTNSGVTSQQMTIALSITITTTSPLPDGTLSTPYRVTLSATGGPGGYIWSLTSASNPLPAGLTLSSSGVLSTGNGNLVQSGSYMFTVQVTDSSGQNAATKTFTMNVDVPTVLTTLQQLRDCVGSQGASMGYGMTCQLEAQFDQSNNPIPYAVTTPVVIGRSGYIDQNNQVHWLMIEGVNVSGDPTILQRASSSLTSIMEPASASITLAWIQYLTFDGNRYMGGIGGAGISCQNASSQGNQVDLNLALKIGTQALGGIFTVWWVDFINSPNTALTLGGQVNLALNLASTVSYSNFGQGGWGIGPNPPAGTAPGNPYNEVGPDSATRFTAAYLTGNYTGAYYNNISYAGTAGITLEGTNQIAYGNTLFENRYEQSDGAGGGAFVLWTGFIDNADSTNAAVASNTINGNCWPAIPSANNPCPIPPPPSQVSLQTGCPTASSSTPTGTSGVELNGLGHTFYNNEISNNGGAGITVNTTPQNQIPFNQNVTCGQEGPTYPGCGEGLLGFTSNNPWNANDNPKLIEMNNYMGIIVLGPPIWNSFQGVTLDNILVRNNGSWGVGLYGVSANPPYSGFINGACILNNSSGIVERSTSPALTYLSGYSSIVPPSQPGYVAQFPGFLTALQSTTNCPNPWPAQTPPTYIPPGMPR